MITFEFLNTQFLILRFPWFEMIDLTLILSKVISEKVTLCPFATWNTWLSSIAFDSLVRTVLSFDVMVMFL